MIAKYPFLLVSVIFWNEITVAQSAAVIFTNANIITAIKKGDRQQAMVVKDGVIVFAGSNKDALKYKTPDGEIVDVHGSTIIPGLNDVHLHPWPETAFNEPDHILRLDTVTSLVSLSALIARKSAITPKGMLIRGRGYNESKLGGEPLRDVLDKAAPDHPVYLTHASGHKAAANSYLLSLNNITKQTADPPGGAFDRYANGEPNGICKESAQGVLIKNKAIVPYPTKTKEQELNNYRKYFNNLLSFGITSIGDAGTDTTRLRLYEALVAEHFPMRFNIMIVDRLLPEMEGGDAHHETDEWKALSYFENGTIAQIETDFLRVKSIKVFHGNSLSAKTCWLYEPYDIINPATGKKDYFGIPYKRSQAQLDSLFMAIHKKGLQICVHSNGDREIDMVLNAFEKVYAMGNPLHLHHRIEHCSVINESILARIKKLGVIPVLHSYISELGDLLDAYGDERLNNMFATKSFLDAGILPAMHSDAPVSSFDTRARIESAVLRTAPGGRQLGPAQCIDAEDALIMYTKGGANATEESDRKGTLEKGRFADFVIVSEDLTSIPANQIHSIHIQQTWVAGKLAWAAAK